MSQKIELLRVMETIYLGVRSISMQYHIAQRLVGRRNRTKYKICWCHCWNSCYHCGFGFIAYLRGISERHILHKSVQDSAGFSTELIAKASMSTSFMGRLRDMVKLFYTDIRS